MPLGKLRDERVQLRLNAASKRRLERAAAYEQKTVTDFVLASAEEAAARVIEDHERVPLAPPDWDVLMAALRDPPPPNAKLQAALHRHRTLTRSR